MTRFSILLTLLITSFFSPLAFASTEKLPWHLYLMAVIVISCILAFFITKSKKNIETFGIKILIAGIYFWVITFIQLTILALLYHFFY